MYKKLDTEFAKYISKKYNIPFKEVKPIYKHPFLFLKELIKHPDDTTPLKLRYLGKFQLKARWADKKTDVIEQLNEANIRMIEAWEKKTNRVSNSKIKLKKKSNKLDFDEVAEAELRQKLLKEADDSFGKAFKFEDISTLMNID